MEEQKNNSKEVKMQAIQGQQDNNQNQQELSYEDLKTAAIQLSKENQYLKAQLQGATETLRTINRLDYLFKVLEQGSYFDKLYIDKCVEEIKKVMTPPQELEEVKKDSYEADRKFQ